MNQIRKRLTYANVMSSIAVFLMLGGGAAIAAGGLGKNSVGSKQLKKGAVTEAKLADGSVAATKLADGSVAATKLADGSVAATKLADGSVGVTKLADGSVTAPKLAASSVTSGAIAAGQVRASDLGPIRTVSVVSSSIPANSNGSATANCNPGELVIGGGNDGYYDVNVVASRQIGNGWVVYVKNVSTGVRTITTYAYCLAG